MSTCDKPEPAIPPFKRFEEQTPEEQAKNLEKMKIFLKNLDKDLANLEHQMKVDIWTAWQEKKILHINMKDGRDYYGRPSFATNETYETKEKLNKMFHFNILVANGIAPNSGLGGAILSFHISNINSIGFY